LRRSCEKEGGVEKAGGTHRGKRKRRKKRRAIVRRRGRAGGTGGGESGGASLIKEKGGEEKKHQNGKGEDSPLGKRESLLISPNKRGKKYLPERAHHFERGEARIRRSLRRTPSRTQKEERLVDAEGDKGLVLTTGTTRDAAAADHRNGGARERKVSSRKKENMAQTSLFEQRPLPSRILEKKGGSFRCPSRKEKKRKAGKRKD